MHPFIWLNGGLVPAADACVSVQDAGFLRGDGLFETMRAYDGVVLDLDRHLDRLARSAAAFRLAIPQSAALAEAVDGLIERNGVGNAAVRLTVTRGSGTHRPGLPQDSAPTICVTTADLPPHATDGRPIRLATATVRIDGRSPLAGHKVTSYLPFLHARQEALDRGADEALLLNPAGRVTECATANVFAVLGDGRVVTPALSEGCLPGVVRATVLNLCTDQDLRAEECAVSAADLLGADEVFVTNSLRELTPVSHVDGTPLLAAPGRVTRRLTEAYAGRAADLTGANR